MLQDNAKSQLGTCEDGVVMGRCPLCGADRLVTLSFQVSRLDAPDQARPDVVAMRPLAKCAGCGARIHAEGTPTRVRTESGIQTKSRQ